MQLEEAFGGRQVLSGDIPADKKLFDDMGVAFAALWPKVSEELNIGSSNPSLQWLLLNATKPSGTFPILR